MISLYDLLCVVDIHFKDYVITYMDEVVDVSHLHNERGSFKDRDEARKFLSQYSVENIKWEETQGVDIQIEVVWRTKKHER